MLIDAGLGLLSILVGIGLIWLAKHHDIQFGEVSKTALILLPLLAFLVLSGKLTELELSGLKARFKEITSEKIIDTARAADFAISSSESNDPNFFRDAVFQQCRAYYVISDNSAKKDGAVVPNAAINIAKSIRASIICGKFQGLVVVDSAKKPIGLFSRHQFIEILRLPLEVYSAAVPPDWEKLFKDIMASELGVVLANPEIRGRSDEAHRVTVAWNDQLQDAYKKMNESGVEVAMITDRQGRFDGIVTRSAIESRVIGKLIEPKK